MKKLILCFSLIAGAASLQGQETCFPYNAGGFGHFFTGPTFFHPNKLFDYMEKPDVMNTNISARPGHINGGEGMALMGHFLIGGGGFGENTNRIITDSARADFSFGAGYFKFGYICKYCKGNFSYVYAGVGWGGINVQIENLSSESEIRFNHRSPILPGRKANYVLPCTFYDLGISYKHIFMSGKSQTGEGGFMLGLDLGCSIAISNTEWQGPDDEVVTGPPQQQGMLNPYLRITIGGGGFGLKEEKK